MFTLTGSDVVEVLRARVRQLSYEQARVLATLVELGLCDLPEDGSPPRTGLTQQCRFGRVLADIARTMLTAHHTAQWRYAITDPAGRLLLAGLSVTSLCEVG